MTTGRGGSDTFDCLRCGKYGLTTEAEAFLENRTPLSNRQIANTSGYIRENQGLTIYERDLNFVTGRPTPSIVERATKLLVAMATEWPEPGSECYPRYGQGDYFLGLRSMLADGNCTIARCDTDVVLALKLMGACWAASGEEVEFLLEDYLCTQGLLRLGIAHGKVITPAGWERIEELKRGTIPSITAFVAMSFSEALRPLFDLGLYPGIRGAGYDALRIDRVEHNNKIDDEIIAAIRRSKFLVADFTVLRGSIYFEAGFAMGLWKPVIWTVREENLHDVHFDNRQYNFIQWQPEKLADFAKALQNRIESTLGRGPLAADT